MVGVLRLALPRCSWVGYRTGGDLDSAQEAVPRLPPPTPPKQSTPLAPTRPPGTLLLPPPRRRAKARASRRALRRLQKSAASRRLIRIEPAKFRQRSSANITCKVSLPVSWDSRHASGDAALSGGSGMAIEDDSRFPGADQTWIRSQPRSLAQSGKCDDNARFLAVGNSEVWNARESCRKRYSPAVVTRVSHAPALHNRQECPGGAELVAWCAHRMASFDVSATNDRDNFSFFPKCVTRSQSPTSRATIKSYTGESGV